MIVNHGWIKSFSVCKGIRVIRILFLGFSSGLPILLIFSTLSLWLKSASIERSKIHYLVEQVLLIALNFFGLHYLII